jgi:hypothetical protein
MNRLARNRASIPGLSKRQRFNHEEINMTSVHRLLPEYMNKFQYPKRWDYGKPRDFWTANLKLIESLIRENKLIPAKSNELPLRQEMEAMELLAASAHQERAIKPRPFPGGMLIPHLHYGGDVYVVPQELWQKISMEIRDSFLAKLSKANSLSFDQVMTLSEAIDTM